MIYSVPTGLYEAFSAFRFFLIYSLYEAKNSAVGTKCRLNNKTSLCYKNPVRMILKNLSK